MQKLNNTRRTHKTQQKETYNKYTNSKKTEQQKYRISSPQTSANKSHKIFAEVRGLDIPYFYLLKRLSYSFLLFFVFCFFLFLFQCFRLVCLSFCIYNRQNMYKHKTQNNSKKNITTTKQNKQNSPSRNLRDIYSRSVRGLDILYFVF